MIRTLLAMPSGLLRGALRFVLSTQDDIEVVAEQDDIDEVVAGTQKWQPDVTVLDLAMVGLDAASTARHPLFELPDCSLLVLVDPRRPGALHPSLATSPPRAGFLASTVAPERVLDGIRRLHRGQPVIDTDLVIAALRARSPLTPQEARVLRAAAQGVPVKEIAHKLGLSPGTVRNYMSRVIAKTGARTRIEAVHIAQRSGWL